MNRSHLAFFSVAIAITGTFGCSGPAEAADDEPTLSLHASDDGAGLTGEFSANGRRLFLKTIHGKEPGSNAVYARVADDADDALCADTHASWPADRSFESFSSAERQRRVDLMALLPSLKRALVTAPHLANYEADQARLLQLVDTVASLPPSESGPAEAPSGTRLQGSVFKPYDGWYYGLNYEIRKKPAFISGSPFDHSAMLVKNVAAQPGQYWTTFRVYNLSNNAGTPVSDPAMIYHCSHHLDGKWFDGSSSECPGTAGGIYGIQGVCNNSTLQQKMEMLGYSRSWATEYACFGTSILWNAPSCDPLAL